MVYIKKYNWENQVSDYNKVCFSYNIPHKKLTIKQRKDESL